MASQHTVVTNQPMATTHDHDFYSPPELKEGNDKEGYPPELEYLKHLDQLIVKQKIEIFEALTGCETKNRYVVMNSMGQQCYYIQEESGCCMRICCGPAREFTMRITDNNNREVIRLRRPLLCCVAPCCIGCCSHCEAPMYVESPPGNVIGQVDWDKFCCYPTLKLADKTDQRFGTLTGPCFCCICCWDVDFPISGIDNERIIGQTTKVWKGCCKEVLTDADNFNISFPIDMDPKVKAVMFASAIALDFVIGEHQDNNN